MPIRPRNIEDRMNAVTGELIAMIVDNPAFDVFKGKCVTVHYISKTGIEIFSAPISDVFMLGSDLKILVGDCVRLGLCL
jgi:hypothetical protein